MSKHTDILVVNALKMELDAFLEELLSNGVEVDEQEIAGIPCHVCALPTDNGTRKLVLTRPTRMGSVSAAAIAAPLAVQLQPLCLAMSGVCAGNPSDVALGDVIVAETAYTYDEGKRTEDGFEGDHRQIPLADRWVRIAQDFQPSDLSTFGLPTIEDRCDWLIMQLQAEVDTSRHPAKDRYLGANYWTDLHRDLETSGVIRRAGDRFTLTAAGRRDYQKRKSYGVGEITQLPFAVHTGPMASGNVVVKDGLTWDMLKALGVRTVLGLEMEAAAIARVAHTHGVPNWIVAKGVMDYADPRKDDRFKPFAAKASAQVLLGILKKAPFAKQGSEIDAEDRTVRVEHVNHIGDVTGTNITVNQVAQRSKP